MDVEADAIPQPVAVGLRVAVVRGEGVDAPDVDAYRSLMAQLAAIRASILREDALRLEMLIERRTGVKP